MDECACGNMKDECSYACAACLAQEQAEARERATWNWAYKQARDGNYSLLNDLIDQSVIEKRSTQ